MFGKVCKNFYSGSSVHTQPQLCLSQALPRWECNTIPLKSWLFFHRLIWHIGTTWLFPKHLGRLKCIDCSTRRGTGSAKLTPGNTPRTQPLRMSLSFRRRHFLLCWRVDCSHPGWYNVLGDRDPVWHQPAQQAPRWSDSTASPLLHLTTLACPGVHHLLFSSCFQNPVSSVSSDLVICSSGFISTNGAHTKLEKNSSNTLNSDNSIGWCIICLAGGKGGKLQHIQKCIWYKEGKCKIKKVKGTSITSKAQVRAQIHVCEPPTAPSTLSLKLLASKSNREKRADRKTAGIFSCPD